MMQWIQAHQVLLLLMWPTLTAVASMFYKMLDAKPRWHAFFSLLVAMGIDLPKMWDAIGRIFTGNSPGGGGTSATADTEKKPLPSSFPKKPVSMRVASQFSRFHRIGRVLVFSLIILAPSLTGGTLLIGCSGLNIVSIVTQLSTYVTAFIQVAQTIWATILPLLGSNGASANVVFNDAIVSLQNANALMMDGEQAYEAGKTVNLPQLMQAVQDAVQRVMAVINQFKGSMPANGYAVIDKTETLERMAISIRHWQEAR